MSKKMLWGATLPGCVVLALVWATMALSGNSLANPPDGDGNHDHGGGGGDGGGGGTIPMTVTFRDFPGDDLDPVPDRLMSDGLGDYIHKVDKVGAGISTRGNFRLTLTKGNQPAIRTLFYDFSDCVVGPCNPPFQNGFSVRGANVVTSGSGIDLLEMLVGEVRDDLRLIMMLNLDSVENGLWQVFFDPFNANCSDSTFVTVERINADTWEIEAGLDDVACLTKQAGGGEHIFSGLYHMPFKMTVKIK